MSPAWVTPPPGGAAHGPGTEGGVSRVGAVTDAQGRPQWEWDLGDACASGLGTLLSRTDSNPE